jgi:hypothetical protein
LFSAARAIAGLSTMSLRSPTFVMSSEVEMTKGWQAERLPYNGCDLGESRMAIVGQAHRLPLLPVAVAL